MYALHSTLLPPSAIHHSLFLPHFTPSTIYPLPKAHAVGDSAEVKVVGNLVVAGGQDLRVFEIREELRPVQEAELPADGTDLPDDLGDSFFDAPTQSRAPVRYETTRHLHLLTRHQLHGQVTGLAPLRTIESSVDGLDRLLVSIKDAKLAILEWARGDIATVSLHTYERCQQMLNGDFQGYIPLLRSDPLSRLAILTLPEDTLAILPLLQEQSELDPTHISIDAPYSPSFSLPLSEVSPNIKNVRDLLFLPGFHSPTLALLFEPMHTWAGRYRTNKDTFHLEIRTFDAGSSTYPLLTSATGLPSDSQYIVACPTDVGGVVVVASTGIVHIDQSGRRVNAAINAWWEYTTSATADKTPESRRLSLEGSHAEFVSDRDMLLVLQTGHVHQVRFEMDGRVVGTIKIDEQSSTVPPPSTLHGAGKGGLFIGSSEGDSLLAEVDLVREVITQEVTEEKKEDMEVDWDEDLYGAAPTANGSKNAVVTTGPATVSLKAQDVLAGVGRISDIEFGIAVTDSGTRTYPQLVVLAGGSNGSTVNVFRRGIPITKRRRFEQLSTVTSTWFLPVQRSAAQKFKDIPDAEQTTILFATDREQTKIFSLSTKTTQDQIGKLPEPTVHVGLLFNRSSIVHVSSTRVLLMDSDANVQHTICAPGDNLAPIVSASIADPYVVIRRSDGSITVFVGDSMARTVAEATVPADVVFPVCQSAEVFTDVSGVYRTFEATQQGKEDTTVASKPAARSRTQLTGEQLRRLQDAKPAIALDSATTESTINASRGTQWLATLADDGELQIRSLPDLQLVLQSRGVYDSEASFTDDLLGSVQNDGEESDDVLQMLFCPVGTRTHRPHLLVLHKSGRLNIFEAQPRFTLDAKDQSRRSLAVRFRRVHTQLLPSPAVPTREYAMMPFAEIEGYTGAFIVGDKPHWIMASDAHPLQSFGLKQPAYAFGKTTHHGGRGEYYIRIEEGSFLCYLPPTLNTDFSMPCDRYKMDRTYTHLAFDPSSGHYVGAAAMTVPFQAYDEEGEILVGPEGPNLVPPTNQRASLELFSAGSDPWRVIDGYEFDQNEAILCIESVMLESAASPTGFRNFIAVGTGKNFGEDRATHGAVYVFEVDEIVGDVPDVPHWRLRFCCKDPTRNPVSAIANIDGYIIHSNGPKVLAKGLDYDDRLMGLAFLDVSMYVTSIRVFKNLILIGDFVKSLIFATMQETPYKFTTIARDLHDRGLVSGDFLILQEEAIFVTNDRNGDMRLLVYDTKDVNCTKREQLLVQTEYHGGAVVTASKTIARRRQHEDDFASQSQLIFGTSDGSLTTLVAVKNARFKRLQLVQAQLVRNAQHVAGLNPRAFRTVPNDLMPRPLTKGVLDGGLLAHFALQPNSRQREMMRQIGTDAVTVASDLAALGGFW